MLLLKVRASLCVRRIASNPSWIQASVQKFSTCRVECVRVEERRGLIRALRYLNLGTPATDKMPPSFECIYQSNLINYLYLAQLATMVLNVSAVYALAYRSLFGSLGSNIIQTETDIALATLLLSFHYLALWLFTSRTILRVWGNLDNKNELALVFPNPLVPFRTRKVCVSAKTLAKGPIKHTLALPTGKLVAFFINEDDPRYRVTYNSLVKAG